MAEAVGKGDTGPRPDWYRALYDGVEAQENYRTPADLAAYRRGLLEKTRPQAEFIRKHADVPMRLLEIGTGNGRLPICLAGMGALAHARGFDVSRSRIEFARLWARDAGVDGVEFEVGDILEGVPGGGEYDLAVCITGAFGYFAAAGDGPDRAVLSAVAGALAPGGSLILELYSHPALRERCLRAPGRTVRDWEPLPPGDPFTWYLHEVAFDPGRSILSHRKIFIRREDGRVDDGRCEYLRIYGDGEIERMLGEAGLDLCAEADGFRGDESDRRYGARILVARKE